MSTEVLISDLSASGAVVATDAFPIYHVSGSDYGVLRATALQLATYVASTITTGGTVTSIPDGATNGVSWTVTNRTTTPTFTFTLGAITPTTVNGVTFTTGTGTLTLGTKTLTVSQNVTLSSDGTGTRTLNIGAGGTLGTGAFAPAGSGDVVGPASATDGLMALFDGTTGKLLKVGAVPFDPASPGALGGTTPAAGTFTALSTTTSMGAFNGFTGTPMFKTGFASSAYYWIFGRDDSGSFVFLEDPSGANTPVEAARLLTGGGIAFGAAHDTILLRAAANTLAQRNGTNPQTFILQNSISGGDSSALQLLCNGSLAAVSTVLTGSGLALPLYVGTSGAAPLYLVAVNSVVVTISSAGLTLGSGTAITSLRHGVSGAMTAGAVTVTDTGATASTRYYVTPNTLGTVTTPASGYASSRSNGASFVITSSSAIDTSTWYWFAVEP